MNRITNDHDHWWPPEPLILGNRLYHWTCYSGVVEHAVYTPRFYQLQVQCDLTPLVIKETRWLDSGCPFQIQPGHDVDIIALGELAVRDFYYYVGIIDHNLRACFPLSGWFNQIEPATAGNHFGVRTVREVKQVYRTYHAAVAEVCYRACGDHGQRLVERAAADADVCLSRMRFRR